MGEIVNLNKRRKVRQRLEEKKRAAENRFRHGRAKTERNQTKNEQNRASKALEDKRID